MGKKQIELECIACGLMFFATREDKKTCSPKCRKALSRWHASVAKPLACHLPDSRSAEGGSETSHITGQTAG